MGVSTNKNLPLQHWFRHVQHVRPNMASRPENCQSCSEYEISLAVELTR